MEKERFLELARNYTSLSTEETAELEPLAREFPFSQILHHLTTRGSQDNQLPSAKTALHRSAVYSTDRAVLKALITAPRALRRATATAEAPADPVTLLVNPGLSGDELIQEVMTDLNRLQELKHNFEVSFLEFNKRGGASLPTGNNPKGQDKSPEPPRTKKTKALPDAPKPEPTGDVLLEEIKTTKKQIVPESPRQKAQIEIIDQFIKKQPSISKSQPVNPDAPDLAEKSISLTDNIVSETLVEILLKQGKKDKAVEVLKKLIWKFPQKKSIFAAQIEELKK